MSTNDQDSDGNEAVIDKLRVDNKELILSFEQLRKRMLPIRKDKKVLKRVYNLFVAFSCYYLTFFNFS